MSDTDRLNWLERNPVHIDSYRAFYDGGGVTATVHEYILTRPPEYGSEHGAYLSRGATLRAAIDSVMAEPTR